MRLFIAINFSESIKDCLCNTIEALKKCAVKGNFTKRENLHITLVFLGEVENIDAIKSVMDNIKSNSFEFTLGKIGKFKRDGGDIYWVGVLKNENLTSIYNQLYSGLTKNGFNIESREYKPHLTIGREVILNGIFDYPVPKIQVGVNKVSLMKSERIKGSLTYTEVYKKEL